MPPPAPLILPDGRPLPLPYRWLHAHGIRSLTPWHFIDTQTQANGLRDEFLREVAPPNPAQVRDWFPFASLQTQDDFAGFVIRDGDATGEVAVVHLTWARKAEQPGFPSMTLYRDGWHWIARCVLPDTQEWAELNGDDTIFDLLTDD